MSRTNDELEARVIVLEGMAITALGMAIRYGRFDYPPERVVELLNAVKRMVRGRVRQEKLSPSGNAEAERYLDHGLVNTPSI
jgi:hypothetical protein